MPTSSESSNAAAPTAPISKEKQVQYHPRISNMTAHKMLSTFASDKENPIRYRKYLCEERIIAKETPM
jgi:hypothetical protein